MGKLDDLRAQIDGIDERILALLEERAGTAAQVAEAKREAGLTSYYDPERERGKLEKLAALGAGLFPELAIRAVFREIMSAHLSLQAPITVAFLGPEGTFSHMAARHVFGLAARYREAATVHGVFDAVQRGDAFSGVVPVENSSEGSDTSTLDALVEGNLLICRELILESSLCLLSRADGLTSIDRVYSPPQALAQCRLWLSKNLVGAQLVHTNSATAAAREALADGRSAAVGSRLLADLSGLPLLGERIQDRAENATRFVVVSREDARPTGADKTTLAFSLPDAGARGALKRVLDVFDQAGINLTRIESRPKRGKPWEYLFLVDIEGHRQEVSVGSLIERLAAGCDMVKVLGSYPRVAPA